MNDRKPFLILICVISFFTVFDLIEDYIDGAELQHLLTESIIITSCLGAGLLVWRSSLNELRVSNASLTSELGRVREELSEWRSKTSSIYAELHEAILEQLKKWGLSEAEADIALLLLKGFSHKEIANLRHTNEQTVRQQAAAVYNKSGLSGRAQFSAFFLEDLLGTNPIIDKLK